MSLPENIRKWYNDFLSLMRENGYNVLDPMSNHAIQGFLAERRKSSVEAFNYRWFYAGIPADEEGFNVGFPEDGSLSYEWMRDNFVAPANYSEDVIKQLYKLANEGRIVFIPKENKDEDRRLLYTDDSGKPVLSGPLGSMTLMCEVKLLVDDGKLNKNLPPRPALNEAPSGDAFSPEFQKWEKDNSAAIKNTNRWYGEVLRQLRPDFLEMNRKLFPGCADPLKFAESFSAFKEAEGTSITSEWYTGDEVSLLIKAREFEGDLFKDYYAFPEYYSTEEGKKARIDALKEFDMNGGEDGGFLRNLGTHADVRKMLESTGLSVEQLRKNGMITYEDGSPFPADKYSWNTVDRILTETGARHKEVIVYDRMENGRPAGPHRIRAVRGKIKSDVPFPGQKKAPVQPKPFIPENMVADITDGTTEKAGASMSSRQRMKIKMEDGNEIKGYFTPVSVLGAKGKYNDTLDMLIERYSEKPNDPVAQGMTAFYSAMKERCSLEKFCSFCSNLANVETSKEVLEAHPLVKMENINALARFARSLGLDNETVTLISGAGLAELMGSSDELMKEVIRQPDVEENNNDIGIATGSNLNRRNNAMTGVADLLGIGSSIARSVNMTTVNGKKQTSGTFMLNAEGLDTMQLVPSRPGFGRKILTIAPEGLRSMNNLQILDYLCANVDRHGKNFLYQTDCSGNEIKITGIQGIDNDMSFGEVDHRGETQIRRMSCLPDIKVIDRELAENVMKLRPENLERVMREQGLSAGEINCAKLRLSDLKEWICAGRIDVVSGRDWENVRLADLNAGKKSDNIFAVNARRIDVYNFKQLPYYRQHPVNRAEENGNERELKASSSVTENTAAQFKSQISRLNEIRDSFIKTDVSDNSPEFDRMYKALGKLIDYTDRLSQSKKEITDREYNTLSDIYADTQKKTADYIRLKKAVPSTSRGKKRLDLAKNLEAYCKASRHTVLEESVAAMNVRLKASAPDYLSVVAISSELRLNGKPEPADYARRMRSLLSYSEKRARDSAFIALCGEVAEQYAGAAGEDEDYIAKTGLTTEEIGRALKLINAGREAKEQLKPAEPTEKKIRINSDEDPEPGIFNEENLII